MTLDPELKPYNWEQFTLEEKKEFLSLTHEEQALFKIFELDKSSTKLKDNQKRSEQS